MTSVEPPRLLRAIAGHAAQTPDRTAVESGKDSTGYGELWREAGQVARSLGAEGVGSGDIVAVAADRGAPFVISALGCWLAGAAYLPLDPANPHERVHRILHDSGARTVLAGEGRADAFAGLDLTVLPPGHGGSSVLAAHQAPPTGPARVPDSAAYVLYTSGSTGEPKGVVVGHDALANLADWHVRTYDVGPADRVLHTAGLGFDAAAWELWPSLAAGATLVVCPDGDRVVPDFIAEQLARDRCTVTFLATALAEEVLSLALPLPDLRYLLTGGDVLRLPVEVSGGYRLVNHYGPTEATVVTTAHPVLDGQPGERPPIGRPIDGVDVLLLDDELRPVAEGAEGEIFIGGRGLAFGYLGDPELTEARFRTLPDRAGAAGVGAGRWYRTGDLAVSEGGVLHFRGRADLEQLKVRGVRVEAAEIEAALMACAGVDTAAVTVVGHGAGAVLVATVVGRTGHIEAQSVATLRGELAARLPTAVLPNRFRFVERLPLTPNGKLDRRRIAQDCAD